MGALGAAPHDVSLGAGEARGDPGASTARLCTGDDYHKDYTNHKGYNTILTTLYYTTLHYTLLP